jgi:hypothetical protein
LGWSQPIRPADSEFGCRYEEETKQEEGEGAGRCASRTFIAIDHQIKEEEEAEGLRQTPTPL